MPTEWKLEKSDVLSADQVSQISTRLGAKVEGITNDHYVVGKSKLQINIIKCATVQDATNIHAALLKTKGSPIYCLHKDKQVAELISAEPRLVIEAGYMLNFVPRKAQYKISYSIVPLAKCDYSAFNKLFNLFLEYQKGQDNAKIESQIAELSKGFSFGDSIALRTLPPQTRYEFSKTPSQTETLAGGDVTRYSFADLPKVAGAPYVQISGVLDVSAFEYRKTTRKIGKDLLGQTTYWPVEDKEVKDLSAKITANAKTDVEKVQCILDWLVPGKNIKFGTATGSRYGVKQALKQGFGQCWDFSDIFVSLSRASGVPCRQVGGWLYGQDGHIWAEVYIDGQGWQYVDPTAGSACGVYHVPFFLTEDGEMPILYVSMPKAEILKQE